MRCRCAPGGETDIGIVLREAMNNAGIHGKHEDPEKAGSRFLPRQAEEEVLDRPQTIESSYSRSEARGSAADTHQ